MKLLVGAALLLALFALGLALQRRWRSEGLAGRERARAALEAGEEPEPGWGKVILGAPGGGAPQGSEPAPLADVPAPGMKPAPAAVARVFELRVARGQTLSLICKEHYGSARAELVVALARYNSLVDAGAVREGQTLRLPPLETLTAK